VRYIGLPRESVVLGAAVEVPSTDVDVLVVDAKVVPIEVARTHFINLDDKTPETLDLTYEVSDVSPKSTGFEVTFKARSTKETLVWVRVREVDVADRAGSAPIERTASVKATPPAANVDFTVYVPFQPLAKGLYSVLVLVPGVVPWLSNETV
jgi:hypothetical protein